MTPEGVIHTVEPVNARPILSNSDTETSVLDWAALLAAIAASSGLASHRRSRHFR